jgi:renalase
VIIVGAGLSGLVAATALQAAGRPVVVVDKGRSVGGRLATRRLVPEFVDGPVPRDVPRGVARVDHGAQFFTVRSPDFAELVHEWRRAGLIKEWCQGFSAGRDGYPRYCAEGGMNTIAKYLASTVDVRCDVVVRAVGGDAGVLSVLTESGERFESNQVVLTAPVPQSLALIDNGWLPLDDALRDELEAVTYAKCIALLVALDGPSSVAEPGGMQFDEATHPVWSFVGDNYRKGISDVPAVTFHANERFSEEHYYDDESALRDELLAAARPFFGSSLAIAVEVKKWRYARPTVLHSQRYVSAVPLEETQLVFCGDAFGEARIEGAALSGLGAAEALLQIQ